MNMEIQTKIIPVELSDGTIIRVEATVMNERKVNFSTQNFKEITTAVESLSKEIAEVLYKVKPDRAKVKFGVEIAVESGKLTALFIKGTSTANFEITLEWGP
jgi:hypothetical protein